MAHKQQAATINGWIHLSPRIIRDPTYRSCVKVIGNTFLSALLPLAAAPLLKQKLTNLFNAVKIIIMQSNKSSKKTSKTAAETKAPVADATAAETATKPRAARSSNSKNDSIETSAVKRHRKAATPVAEEPKPAMVVAVPMSIIVEAPAVVVAVTPAETQHMDVAGEPTYEQIALLAHALWTERGSKHGNHEADWLRAEQQLKAATALG